MFIFIISASASLHSLLSFPNLPSPSLPSISLAIYSTLQTTLQPDVCLSVHRCICIEKKNQLDATEWFIAIIIRSTCFGHFYAHHHELKTICVLLPPMVCGAWLLVVGGQVPGSRPCVQEEGCCTTAVLQHPSSRTHSLLPGTWPLTTNNQALHTIGGNTHIYSRAPDDVHRSAQNMLSIL
jgi:hypothetical protein